MSRIGSKRDLVWRLICIALAFCFMGVTCYADDCPHANTDNSTIETYESIAGDSVKHELVGWMQTLCLDCLHISAEQLYVQEEPHQFESNGSVLTCKWCEYQTTEETMEASREAAAETENGSSTIPQVCGICGTSEECTCADVLFALEDHLAYITRLLNGETCTGLCPVHCDSEGSYLEFMQSQMEFTEFPEVSDSAMTGDRVCRICLLGDDCSCAERYIEAEGQFSFICMLYSRGGCTELCPLHWDEYTSGSMYVIITNSNANIRSGPDGSAPRLGNAVYGEVFPYLGESGNWYMIDVCGQTGYVVKELSALQDHAEIEPTQRTTVAATPRPTATPAAAIRPTATPCSHPGFTKVEGEIKDLGNGEWKQECYKICTACGDVIDVFYRVGGIKIEAIPSNTSTPTPKPTATPCAHSSTSEVEGAREDYGNGAWSQEIYEICNHCGAVVDTHNHGGIEIEGGIPVN